MEYYVHHVPGRLRIQTPFIHHDEENARKLTEFLKGVAGVSNVECHALTGSCTIQYDRKCVNCEKLLCMLEQKGWFNLKLAKTNDEVVKAEAEKVLEVAVKVAESVEGVAE